VTRFALLLAVGTVALAAAGCSRSADQLDSKKVEGVVRQSLTQQFDDDRVTDVACPDGLKVEKDQTFDCTAKVDGETVRFGVTQTDDEGAVSVQAAQAVVDVGTLQARIENSYQQQAGRAVSADCGEQTVIVVKFREAINCTIEDDEGAGETVVASVDRNGEPILTSPTLGGPETASA